MVVVTIRERIEQREQEWLVPGASLVTRATRQSLETESDLRTAYQRDRDRILHSKAFRRLKYKTQVFLSPEGDHFRTRLTHTLEVTQIARTIARALFLNEDLTEAIGMGHDLGHTPFGHAGERALARVFPGFRHNEQSLRVVDRLEKGGQGLNLTDPVRDGILRHSKPEATITGAISGTPQTAEAQIVKIADGIAYINHDFDDAVRGGLLTEDDLPSIVSRTLGESHAERIDTLVHNVVTTSAPHIQHPFDGEAVIGLSDGVLEATEAFRAFLFERVYHPLNQQPPTHQAEDIVTALFEYFVSHPEALPNMFAPQIDGESPERRAADVISGMTDRYATRYYESICPDGSRKS